jgi:hypothetical protein
VRVDAKLIAEDGKRVRAKDVVNAGCLEARAIVLAK